MFKPVGEASRSFPNWIRRPALALQLCRPSRFGHVYVDGVLYGKRPGWAGESKGGRCVWNAGPVLFPGLRVCM